MSKRTSRLYRRIPDAPKPLFEVYVGGLRFDDDSITSISINAGSNDATGIQASVCELDVPKTILPSHSGSRTTVRLTYSAANWIASRVGATVESIRDRYTGRASQITIEDVGTAQQRRTTLAAAHWLALENGSTRPATVPKGTYINNAVRALLYRHNKDYVVYPRGAFDQVWEQMDNTTWKDVGTKLTGDYGILLSPRRNGDVIMAQLPWRYDQALASVGTAPTLVRSQVLSPTTWEQPNEANITKFLVKRNDENGVYREGIVSTNEALERDAQIEEIDWSWVKTNDSHFIMAAKSRTYSNGISTFRLPKVKINLLKLIMSDHPHDLRQASALLRLEVGDAIPLSGDWHAEVNGIHIVTGYTETITDSAWELELSMSRLLHVFADYSPLIPAEIWASANYSWTTETRTWSEA